MNRMLLKNLQKWLISANRKPLVIRGARQVGKTWLVKHFANLAGKQIIELNFEKQPSYASLFTSNNPQHILLNLSAHFNQKIDVEKCILFLDEIQAVPQLLSKLRWFAEDLRQLPIIATGSLLEFVLADHTFSMPVGRISYMYLEPLSFEEFLLAHDNKFLCDYIAAYDFKMDIPIAIHEQLLLLFKEYILIGGMPAAVMSWVTEHSFENVNQVHYDLLTTYRDDFAKYKGRVAIERLEEVMMAIPKMLGQKFVYSRVNPSISSVIIKPVVTLLNKARVCHRVWSCSANGVPLAAEIKEKYFKEIFLDVGLCSAALGLKLNQINTADEIILINNGGIAEQVVGQILRTIDPPYIEPALYCWNREEAGSNAEIDYIIQNGNNLVPIEVKAGATGSLKSLHLFMGVKKLPLAVRINSDLPSKININVKDHARKSVQYTLLSIPFYLIGQMYHLLNVE